MYQRSLCALTTGALLLLAGCSPEPAEEGGEEPPEPGVYLSLGDSLAVGIQPDENGELRETPHGYTDELHRMLQEEHPSLEHVRLGCSGEDTASMLEGTPELCEYPEGTQLEAAEALLRERGGEVELVTLGIGANNLLGCASIAGDTASGAAVRIDETCAAEGLERLRTDVREIGDRLRTAAGEDTRIVGMTYYNPYLAASLLPLEGSGGREAMEYTTETLGELNRILAEEFAEHGIGVADVAADFGGEDFDASAGASAETPPAVQEICDHTWMCDLARGPDIHTNESGARKIAGTFAEEIGG